MKTITLQKLLLTVSIMYMACGVTLAKNIYVSPNGNDKHNGEINTPLQTIEVAINKAAPTDIIILKDGTYQLEKTLQIPSGKDNITLKAEHPGKATLSMAIEISPKMLTSIKDKKVYARLRPETAKQIKEVDLKKLGISVASFKVLFNAREEFPEIYWGENRLPLSRYPNKGYMTMKRVLDNFGDGTHGGIFEYSDPRHEAWKNAVEEGLWMTGFWRIPWQANTIKIQQIDTEKKNVTHEVGIGVSKNPANNGSGNGIGSKYKRPEGSGEEPYYVINLPEEIDLPGEWCIDFKRQKMYILPPENASSQKIKICYKYTPLVNMSGVNNFTVSGIVFDKSAQNGLVMQGGNQNQVTGCTFKNLGGTAIIIDGGLEHQIKSNDFYALGKEGISAMGGDRKTLTPCNFLIENNYFHNYGLIKDSWAAAVRLGRYEATGSDKAGEDAVGITVRHNLVHDAPHSAFLYVGNLNVFEYNEVFDIAKKTGDVGAFYSRHDWTSRGNVIRHNFIHHIPRANGTYHDDGHTGDSVYNNIIHRALSGTMIGGGHDNVVKDNIYLNCIHQGISLDSRGKHRNYTVKNKNYTFRFNQYNLKQGNWKKLYPEMENFLSQEYLELPHNDIIEGNYFINCPKGLYLSGDKADFRYSPQLSGGTSIKSAKDYISLLIEKRDENILNELGMTIPVIRLSKIGLYKDEFRKSLPDIQKLMKGLSDTAGFNSADDVKATNQQ